MLYLIIGLIICGFLIYMGLKELSLMDEPKLIGDMRPDNVGDELMGKLSTIEKEIEELTIQKNYLEKAIAKNQEKLFEIRKEVELAQTANAFS